MFAPANLFYSRPSPGAVRSVVVAAPEYLARHGAPQAPHDLLAHSTIVSSAGSFTVGWRFASSVGEHPLRVKPRLRVTANDAAIAAACQGLGITTIQHRDRFDAAPRW